MKNGFFVKLLLDAANDINVGKSCIHNVIKGYAKTAGGYKYKYL